MSFQTFVTERLAAITAQLNAIATNAKKIFELPRQNNLDPASLIHVSRGGTSEGLEVQQIIDAIVERNYSQLLSVGEITVSGLTVTIPAGATWVYNGVYYATAATTNITETLCEAGYLRKDILVANQSNQIVLVKGAESLTIRIRPNIPVGTVLVTELDVDDTVIGTPTTPVIGEGYITKREKAAFQVYQSGEINNTYLDDFYYGYLNFRDDDGVSGVTNLKSIQVYSNVHLYSGKEILVKNSQATPFTITHLAGTLGFQCSFPNELDFVINPNEIIRFSMKITGPSSGLLEYVGKINEIPTVAVADVVGLSAALATKVTQAEIDALGTQLLGGAPADGNTLKELNDKIIAVQAIIGGSTADGDSLVNTVAELLAVFSTYSEGVDLVTLLAGKVNTTDVYNALDGIVAGKVLDARQGKVLNDLITALTTVVSGKEASSNKTDTVAGNETSSSLFASIKGMVDWFTATKIRSILGISTLSGSNTGDQDLIFPVTETGTSFSLTNAHNGKITILTASCTVTIPNGLIAGFEHTIVTLASVTLTVALGGSVTLFNNVGTTMAEKLSCTIKNRTATNQYITAGNL